LWSPASIPPRRTLLEPTAQQSGYLASTIARPLDVALHASLPPGRSTYIHVFSRSQKVLKAIPLADPRHANVTVPTLCLAHLSQIVPALHLTPHLQEHPCLVVPHRLGTTPRSFFRPSKHPSHPPAPFLSPLPDSCRHAPDLDRLLSRFPTPITSSSTFQRVPEFLLPVPVPVKILHVNLSARSGICKLRCPLS